MDQPLPFPKEKGRHFCRPPNVMNIVLEGEATAELNQAGLIGLTSDLSIVCASISAGVRRGELRPIEEVEEFRADLDLIPLMDRDSLHD